MKIQLPSSKRARIEILPLIDIVFLLLVFFIYAMLSMAVHRGLPVDLPVSQSAEIDQKLTLSVTIKDDGLIHVNKTPVALEDLTGILRAKSEEASETGVLVFADRDLSYQMIYTILDNIRLAGISRISLQADFESQQ
jgi:biopolymer transport protein ExbD